MKILAIAVGSSGDVHPIVGLSQALVTRGHDVTVMSAGYFRPLVERVGLNFLEFGTVEQFHKLIGHPDLWHAGRGFFYLARRVMLGGMRRQYEIISEHIVPGQSLVLASPISFGARVARDKLGVPLVTIHLQPAGMWSTYNSPRLPPLLTGERIPRWFKRLQFWTGERIRLDPFLCPEINRFLTELGLPRIRNVTTRWWHSPDGVLGLFPEWYAPPQPDWPPRTYLTEFPMWDEGGVTKSPSELDAFLDNGDAPIVFTLGTAMVHGRNFFAAATETCRRLGRRGILLTRFPDQLPKQLPEYVRHFEYIPFSQVLPRAAAIVHHGGIGTTAQGLAAGIPQMIVPLTHDQPDNAARLERLGVGTWINRNRIHSAGFATRLNHLLSSSGVRNQCRKMAERFDGVDPLAKSCAIVEHVAEERLGAAVTAG